MKTMTTPTPTLTVPVAKATLRGLVCPDHHELLHIGPKFHHCPTGHRVDRAGEPERRRP